MRKANRAGWSLLIASAFISFSGQVSLGQDDSDDVICPVPDFSNLDKLKSKGVTAIARKTEAARRFAFFATRKTVLDKVQIDFDHRDNIRSKYRQLGLWLTDYRSRISTKIQVAEEVSEDDIEEYIGEIANKVRSHMTDLKRLVGEERYTRLNQVMRQEYLASQGLAMILVTELAEKVQLTDAQKEEINRLEAETRIKLQESMAQIRADAHQTMLNQLNDAQRKVVAEFLGEDFLK